MNCVKKLFAVILLMKASIGLGSSLTLIDDIIYKINNPTKRSFSLSFELLTDFKNTDLQFSLQTSMPIPRTRMNLTIDIPLLQNTSLDHKWVTINPNASHKNDKDFFPSVCTYAFAANVGLESVLIFYKNQKKRETAEFFAQKIQFFKEKIQKDNAAREKIDSEKEAIWKQIHSSLNLYTMNSSELESPSDDI